MFVVVNLRGDLHCFWDKVSQDSQVNLQLSILLPWPLQLEITEVHHSIHLLILCNLMQEMHVRSKPIYRIYWRKETAPGGGDTRL